MTGHRLLAAQGEQGARYSGRVEEEIIVHQVALAGIAAPYPAVALDAIDEKLPGIEVQGVSGNIVYPVDAGIGAAKIATFGYGRVFVEHGHFVEYNAVVRPDVY